MLKLVLLLALSAEPFRWPEVPVVGVVDIPPVVSQGVPTLLRAVKVKRTTAELMPIFRDAFVKAGLWVPRPPKLVREPLLTAVDPLERRSYTVIFQPNPDGTTTLILGEANHAVRVSNEGELAPLFPGATKLFRSAQETARIEAYEVAAKEAEVEAFYADVLPRAGFKAAGEGVYERGADALTVSVRAAGAVTRVMLITRR